MTVSVRTDGSLVNKRELARHLGTSVVTVGNWIERFGEAFPVQSRGTNGREWQFDLAEVVEFLRERKEAEQRLEAERDATLSQLVLPLLTEPSVPEQQLGSKVSIKEQIEAQRLSTMRRLEMERLGTLVSADEVKAALTETMANLARTLRAAVRSMGHDHNLPPQIVRALETKQADALRGFVRDAASFLTQDVDLLEPAEIAHG